MTKVTPEIPEYTLVTQWELMDVVHELTMRDPEEDIQTEAGSHFYQKLVEEKDTGNHQKTQLARSTAKEALLAQTSFIAEFDQNTIANAVRKAAPKRPKRAVAQSPKKAIASLDDMGFDTLLQIHNKKVERAQPRLEKLLPNFYDKMHDDLAKAISEGHLPSHLMERFLASRRNIRWIVTDDLEVNETNRTYAAISAKSNMAFVDYNALFSLDSEEKQASLYHVFVHEVVHRLGGQAGAVYDEEVKIYKSGLRCGWGMAGEQTQALNEALTEYIAVGISSGNWSLDPEVAFSSNAPDYLSKFYRGERRVLMALATHISPEVLIDHYLASDKEEVSITRRNLHRAFREEMGISYDNFCEFMMNQRSTIQTIDLIQHGKRFLPKLIGGKKYTTSPPKYQPFAEGKSRQETKEAKARHNNVVAVVTKLGKKTNQDEYVTYVGASGTIYQAHQNKNYWIISVAVPALADGDYHAKPVFASIGLAVSKRGKNLSVRRSSWEANKLFLSEKNGRRGSIMGLHSMSQQLSPDYTKLTPKNGSNAFLTCLDGVLSYDLPDLQQIEWE